MFACKQLLEILRNCAVPNDVVLLPRAMMSILYSHVAVTEQVRCCGNREAEHIATFSFLTFSRDEGKHLSHIIVRFRCSKLTINIFTYFNKPSFQIGM
nr:unnamed protein product [Haemonchus contortus]